MRSTLRFSPPRRLLLAAILTAGLCPAWAVAQQGITVTTPPGTQPLPEVVVPNEPPPPAPAKPKANPATKPGAGAKSAAIKPGDGSLGKVTGAQSIAVLVNDEPITGYEIQQRQRLMGMGNANIGERAQANFKNLIKQKSTNDRLKAILEKTVKENEGKSREEIIAIFEKRKTEFAKGLQQQAVENARQSVMPGIRKEALEELIDERLKLQEAKKAQCRRRRRRRRQDHGLHRRKEQNDRTGICGPSEKDGRRSSRHAAALQGQHVLAGSHPPQIRRSDRRQRP